MQIFLSPFSHPINAVETIAFVLVFDNLFCFLFFSSCVFVSFSHQMAAVHAVRSPTTHLHGGISVNLSPSNRNPSAVIRFGRGSSKQNRLASVLSASSLREGDGHGRDSSLRAVEVKKILEDSPLLPSTNPIIKFISFVS